MKSCLVKFGRINKLFILTPIRHWWLGDLNPGSLMTKLIYMAICKSVLYWCVYSTIYSPASCVEPSSSPPLLFWNIFNCIVSIINIHRLLKCIPCIRQAARNSPKQPLCFMGLKWYSFLYGLTILNDFCWTIPF